MARHRREVRLCGRGLLVVQDALQALHPDEDHELPDEDHDLLPIADQVRGQEVNQTRTEERGARLRDIRAEIPRAAAGHADHRPERERQAVGGDAPAERSGARWCVLRDKASQRPARQGHQGEEFRGAQRDGHLRECPKTLEVMRLRGERSEADDLELLEQDRGREQQIQTEDRPDEHCDGHEGADEENEEQRFSFGDDKHRRVGSGDDDGETAEDERHAPGTRDMLAAGRRAADNDGAHRVTLTA